MALTRFHFASFALLLIVLLLLFTEMSSWEAASLGFSLFALLVFLYELGKSIAIRELIVFITTITMVFSPTIILIGHPEDMILSSDDYLSYGLPATMAFSVGMLLQLRKLTSHKILLENVKIYLVDKERTVSFLLILGGICNLIYAYMPVQLTAIVYLFAVCINTSALYGYYHGGKLKKLTLILAAGILLYDTIREGMFGTLLHFTALYFSIILVSRKTAVSFKTKLFMMALGGIFIVLVQSIKMEYRVKTWGTAITDRKADPTLMINLITDRLSNANFLFGEDHLHSTYTRTNQGNLISEAMYYVPRFEPYADGEILLYFLYPFIPRFIWNNKPITGGLANIQRFTRIVHNGASSSNISPLGEGYVNFGKVGGIVFMFFFGLLFNICFHKIMQIAETKPSIILWLPCLFVGCLTLETDVLTVWGSFAIMSTFLFIFWGVCKRINISL
jgi:hypothetical protein